MKSTSIIYLLAFSAFSYTVSVSARSLPRTIIGGYSSWGTCDQTRFVQEAIDGVNLIWWFQINLPPSLSETLLDCIANVSQTLRNLALPTSHLVTVGGWDAPHPVNYTSASEMYQEWKQWNEKIVARKGFESGFDGIDFDLEGFDDPNNAFNTMAVKTLDLVGGFSQLAKADNYIVTLVPCESYLDPTTSLFDRSLLWSYPDFHPEFHYHGHNAYAYFLSRYGLTQTGNGDQVSTFDLTTIQLYESYSHADHNITVLGQSAAEYLAQFVKNVVAGWQVDFSSDPSINWPSGIVNVPAGRLVLGLANGWAGGPSPKSVLIMPSDVAGAWSILGENAPRGIGFWDMPDEGRIPAAQNTSLYMARDLNAFLKTRN